MNGIILIYAHPYLVDASTGLTCRLTIPHRNVAVSEPAEVFSDMT